VGDGLLIAFTILRPGENEVSAKPKNAREKWAGMRAPSLYKTLGRADHGVGLSSRAMCAENAA
jgi:hypothetical protein